MDVPFFIDYADHYWQVPSDLSVFSSSRLAYVPYNDPIFQQWLTDAHIVTRIQLVNDLAEVVQDRVLPLFFGLGVEIDFPSNPSLSSVYGLDATTLDQVRSLASDCSSGLGFPLGASTFAYPDIRGQPHIFTPNEIIGLYKAMRDYVTTVISRSVAIVMKVPGAALPSVPVTAVI